MNVTGKQIFSGVLCIVLVIMLYKFFTSEPYNNIRPKTVVIYAFHVKEGSTREIDNLKFLFDHGDMSKIDMVLVSNGSDIPDFVPNNVKKIKRENHGYDFEAWYHGLDSINKDKYDNFIFMNSSIKGPYLPVWFETVDQHWSECFTRFLDNKIKLVGTTINYAGAPGGGGPRPGFENKHVQSMLWTTDKTGLEHVLNTGVLSERNDFNFRDTILNKEIKLTDIFLDSGYDVKALYMVGMTDRKHADVNYQNNYYNTELNPLETLFYKNNRDLDSKIISLYDEFYDEKLSNKT